MLNPVRSERAEASIRLLRLAQANHRELQNLLGKPSANHRLAQSGIDQAQVARQGTYLRLLSITEDFCASFLLETVERAEPVQTSILTQVWERAAMDAIGSWERQKKAYREWLKISGVWGDLSGHIEVRNAIAHGLGSLTRRQKKNEAATRSKIDKIGVQLDGDRIALSEENVDDAVEFLSELIRTIDGKVPRS